MHETNPYVSPQHEEEAAAAVADPTRPKPWSVLSLLSTAIVVAVVSSSLGLTIYERANASGSPQLGDDGEIVRILVMLQGFVLAYWVAAGSGHIVVRSVLGTLLFAGLYGELVLVSYDPVFPFVPLSLGALIMTALIDTLLLALSSQRTVRSVFGSSMKFIIPIVLVLGLIFWLRWFFPTSWLVRSRALSLELTVPAAVIMGNCVAASGIFLLTAKHRLAQLGWWIGGMTLLAMPVIGAIMEMYVEGTFFIKLESIPLLLLIEVVCLLCIYATHRTLRSYGGALVTVPTADDN
ncbi:hypothetical protein [Blastopirellula marina]|uniref:Uncharacterized protein n=1 Tax=Blastopirellula marina TaxID=124 RepID=A0A2S8FLG4_9BACT|nr:hypothetical protein [Blastopirellula marina]PQO33003.1 hypothetical protein C5Y98_17865 [Blastopirellula marina]PTL43170.1 hypothetical protein C5Y97_17875 [Blastopirellula marina]